jgi:sulfur relay (sulfurtransferase) complex TusBCD TusD component (DsrE family)
VAMESAQRALAEHPISRVFFWRRGVYVGGPEMAPHTPHRS